MAIAQVIQEACDRIVACARPARVILFGSRARSTHRASSDIDLLVLVDQQQGTGRLTDAINEALADLGTPIDVVVMPVVEFEAIRDVIGSVARPAAREGRVLYQRAA